ncbi:MAG: hypothetical protein QOJ29_4574 [Thermoleophilaceae bacterium]|jgi:cell division septation protein DedD|nr:hypothetical protein [Thermoleophilaceae bacterium]
MSTVVDPDTNEQEVIDVDHVAPLAEAPETLACTNCGAPADPGQLMCLECGSRLALDYQRPPSWRLPAAIVGVVLVLAGIGVAVALAAVTNDAGKTTASAPTQPAAAPGGTPADATPTTAAPAPTGSTTTPAPTDTSAAASTTPAATPAPAPATPASGWPPGKSAFTVILASMPTKAAAEDKLKKARAAGISGAALLHSDDFPTLRAGYWVVFDGQYDSVDAANTQATADQGKGEFGDAYPRFVSKDANAKP